VRQESLLAAVEELFSRKGKKVVEANIRAFELGRASPATAGR
jgi:Pyruvate/2-oxoacid:ferredoxin oxidoreductase gamma subunit